MGLAGLAVVGAASEPGRLSHRGRIYLEALQRKWAALESAPVGSGFPVALAVGLFGVVVLSGTVHAALADGFKKAGSASVDNSVAACGQGCGDCGA